MKVLLILCSLFFIGCSINPIPVEKAITKYEIITTIDESNMGKSFAKRKTLNYNKIQLKNLINKDLNTSNEILDIISIDFINEEYSSSIKTYILEENVIKKFEFLKKIKGVNDNEF